ncbi:Hypothetical protein IALB_2018 [Ignavibacterium album JCM 16511]|uniref:Uncharacterized protein n=1 Tax=Ignavibacterium album (strain DSM 19864 / JCM 16511 / NBRC 101810 / Mat9-16) TaxID=945713 RepID=I0AL66_IGNAJ|nr:hypothetical protein [Ignavibacterium album]AFH49723.1 Hypothetical protein IALB_2018 [Ignavibacterium album JCM 16511]
MDFQVIIILIFFTLFGIVSVVTNKLESKSIYLTKIIAISIAILILLVEAIINVEKRFISLLFVLIGLSFLYKQYKLIKNVKVNSEK